MNKRLDDELRRLDSGPSLGERPAGLGTVQFIGHCRENALEVIERVKTVLRIVNRKSALAGQWPSEDEWRFHLPEWFVSRCGPELSQEEAEKELMTWRELRPADQSQNSRGGHWSLPNWIFWFRDENRSWYWWDAESSDNNVIRLAVEVDEWPFPWDAIAWLFLAAGATDLDAKPDSAP